MSSLINLDLQADIGYITWKLDWLESLLLDFSRTAFAPLN